MHVALGGGKTIHRLLAGFCSRGSQCVRHSYARAVGPIPMNVTTVNALLCWNVLIWQQKKVKFIYYVLKCRHCRRVRLLLRWGVGNIMRPSNHRRVRMLFWILFPCCRGYKDLTG